MDKPPSNCNPLDRIFPADWKIAWFRRRAKIKDGSPYPVITCPICKSDFDFTRLDFLEADHIWPYSLFGETIWENFQLLCGSCNSRKSNALNSHVRLALSNSIFRKMIASHLRSSPELAVLEGDAMFDGLYSGESLGSK
jgi:hypothetical protein